MAIQEFRNTNIKTEYLTSARKYANWLSKNTRGREDKYSGYQQIMNMMAMQFEELKKKLNIFNRNLYLPTHDDSTIDVIYYAEPSQEVGTISSDAGTHPKTSQLNYMHWFKNENPFGISIEETNIPITLIDNQELKKEIIVNHYFTKPQTLYLTLASDDIFINNIYGNQIEPTYVIIHGEDRYGKYKNEYYQFYYSTYFKSQTEWRAIHRIESIGYAFDSKLYVTLGTHIGNLSKIEDKSLFYESTEKNVKPIFWSFVDGYLKKEVFAAKSIEEYYSISKEYDSLDEYALLYMDNTTGLTKANAISALWPSDNEDRIYAVINNHLVAYPKNERYSILSKSAYELRTPDPLVNLLIRKERGRIYINGEYSKIRLGNFINQYRISLLFEDGSRLMHDGTNWVPYDANSYVNYPLKNTYGFKLDEITYGDGSYFAQDFIVLLDIIKMDYTTETDTYLVDAEIKEPLFQYSLGAERSPIQINNTASGSIQILENLIISEISFKNNSYYHDKDTGRIIFADNFSNVRNYYDGDNYETLTLKTFNVFNSLDHMAASLSLTRKLGEKNRAFKDRVYFASFNNPGASESGLYNTIMAELGKAPKYAAIISDGNLDINVAKGILTINKSGSAYTLDLRTAGTIADVIDFINSKGITIDYENTDLLTKPAKCIIHQTNIETFKQLDIYGKRKVAIPLFHNQSLKSVYVEGFEYVANETLFETGKKYFTTSNNEVILSEEAAFNNLLYYSISNEKYYLLASDVVLSSPINHMSTIFSYNEHSDYAKDAFNFSELAMPLRWSN